MDTDLTPEERSARIAFALGEGECLRASDASRLSGLTDFGAISLLLRISRVIPIVNSLGSWRKVKRVV